MQLTKPCEVCGKEIVKGPSCSMANWPKRRFCSLACYGKACHGRPNPKNAAHLRGRTLSPEHRAKVSAGLKRAHAKGRYAIDNTGLRGAATSQWKGDAASYRAVHGRIVNTRGRADEHSCVDCGGKAREWSYTGRVGFSTNIGDYEPRCTKCHRAYDALGEMRKCKNCDAEFRAQQTQAKWCSRKCGWTFRNAAKKQQRA